MHGVLPHTSRPLTPVLDRVSTRLEPRPLPLSWLMRAPAEIMDACLDTLSGAERAHLGRNLRAGLRRLPEPQRHMTQLLSERLAASNRRAWMDAIEPGPLKRFILSAIGHNGAVPTYDPQWTTINAQTYIQLADSDGARCELQRRAEELRVPPQRARDLATAVYALDGLSAAAPDTGAWFAYEEGRADGASSLAHRRAAGRQALLAAAGFSAPMQETLLGHVVVGCALAFAGYTQAAEAVFAAVQQRDLSNDLASGQGDRGLHLDDLMLSHGHFVDRCLLWIKTAALVSDSTSIDAVYRHTLTHVPEIDDRYAEPASLNVRWPVLGGERLLGSPEDIAWLRAMGCTALVAQLEAEATASAR